MTLLALGINHQTAPLALRERVAFPADRLVTAVEDLRARLSDLMPEGAILSTCNRTEIYVATGGAASSNAGASKISTGHMRAALLGWLGQHHKINGDDLNPHLYVRENSEAVRHAFRVASGLDSMVLGEPQILGQMKDAARAAQSAHALGSQLHQLFQRSFAVAKEVRTSTEIGTQSVSMAAAAVRLCQRVFGDLSASRVLFVGAGEMIELCATHFAAQHPLEMVVTNRTLERAEKLAQRFSANPMLLADLPNRLESFDIVVSCTASTLPLIGLGMVERALKARRHRPVVMVDLAVPRDIEPEVARLQDVFLYTVDDLGRMVQTNMASRKAAVSQAEAIIETRVESFMGWMQTRQSVPVIKQLHERSDAVTNAEILRARKMLARGDDPHQVIEALARTMAAKFMHGPTRLIKQSNQHPDELAKLQALLDQVMPSAPDQNEIEP